MGSVDPGFEDFALDITGVDFGTSQSFVEHLILVSKSETNLDPSFLDDFLFPSKPPAPPSCPKPPRLRPKPRAIKPDTLR